MGHPLVRFAALIDWKLLDHRFVRCARNRSRAAAPADAACRRPVHPEAYAQFGSGACARWIENPYYNILRRVELLPPAAVRSIVDHALAPAARRGAARRADPGESVGGAQTVAIGAKDVERVAVDTTVQAKGRCASDRRAADASGRHQARRLAKRNRVPLRQVICAWRSAPPSSSPAIPRWSVQARPAPAQVPAGTRTWPDHPRHPPARLMAMPALEARFGPLLDLAQRVRTEDQHQRGPKVY